MDQALKGFLLAIYSLGFRDLFPGHFQGKSIYLLLHWLQNHESKCKKNSIVFNCRYFNCNLYHFVAIATTLYEIFIAKTTHVKIKKLQLGGVKHGDYYRLRYTAGYLK